MTEQFESMGTNTLSVNIMGRGSGRSVSVDQIKGWDGRELMPAFTVQISEHGKTYQYLINNAEFKAYLKIVKVDAETGKNIPYAGAAFEIYDPDGKLVEMTTTYPQPETHSRFVTNDGGWLITPEMLPYGTGYSIVEVQAPHGYVLNPELVDRKSVV